MSYLLKESDGNYLLLESGSTDKLELESSVAGGRIMSSLASSGGLAGYGGIAGYGGGLAG